MEEQGHCGSENLDLAGSAGTIDLHHLLLPKALTPCEALIQVVALLVVNEIINNGKEVECAPLVDLLCIALAHHGPDQPSQLGQAFPLIPLVTLPINFKIGKSMVTCDLTALGTCKEL